MSLNSILSNKYCQLISIYAFNIHRETFLEFFTRTFSLLKNLMMIRRKTLVHRSLKVNNVTRLNIPSYNLTHQMISKTILHFDEKSHHIPKDVAHFPVRKMYNQILQWKKKQQNENMKSLSHPRL